MKDRRDPPERLSTFYFMVLCSLVSSGCTEYSQRGVRKISRQQGRYWAVYVYIKFKNFREFWELKGAEWSRSFRLVWSCMKHSRNKAQQSLRKTRSNAHSRVWYLWLNSDLKNEFKKIYNDPFHFYRVNIIDSNLLWIKVNQTFANSWFGEICWIFTLAKWELQFYTTPPFAIRCSAHIWQRHWPIIQSFARLLISGGQRGAARRERAPKLALSVGRAIKKTLEKETAPPVRYLFVHGMRDNKQRSVDRAICQIPKNGTIGTLQCRREIMFYVAWIPWGP